MADVFQWWENLWNPLAKPTADLASEALRKYQAGEIDFATYQAATDRAMELEHGISDAQSDYEKIIAEKYSFNAGNLLAPVTDLSKNLIALAIVVGAVYILIQWKRLET